VCGYKIGCRPFGTAAARRSGSRCKLGRPRAARRICRPAHRSRRRRVPAGTPARVHLRTGATPVAMTRLR
jgi:hypothetical protein